MSPDYEEPVPELVINKIQNESTWEGWTPPNLIRSNRNTLTSLKSSKRPSKTSKNSRKRKSNKHWWTKRKNKKGSHRVNGWMSNTTTSCQSCCQNETRQNFSVVSTNKKRITLQ